MRSSLRTITDVNIDGQAIDCVSEDYGLSFKVNCDSLSWVVAHYYDYEYGTMQGFYYPAFGTMTAKHNGETFSGDMWPVSAQSSPFLLGHDYTTIIYVFQNYPESSEHPLNTGPGKYDVLMGSGRIKQSTTGNEAYIDPDITSYMSPQMYDGRLIGGLMLKVNGSLYLIKTYNKNTGKITLGNSTTAEDISLSLTEGQLYYLVSNYIQCDPFTWYCRSDPVVTIEAEFSRDGISLQGSYSQAQEVAMQSYQFTCNGEKGDKSFTYTFSDLFPLPYQDRDLNVFCEVSTQENYTAIAGISEDGPITDTQTTSLSCTEQTETRNVRLVFTPGFTISPALTVFIWRVSEGQAVLIKTFKKSGSSASTVYDRTAASGKTYTYYVSAFDGSKLYIASASLSTSAKLVKLTKLGETGTSYHRKTFSLGESISFDVGAETGDVRGVVGTEPIITEDGMPVAVSSNDDYEQGTFTAYLDRLGNISSPIDPGTKRVDKFRSFIASGNIYLFQDNAGNSRVITITDVSRSFDYMSQLTKISFSWTEIYKIGECLIG